MPEADQRAKRRDKFLQSFTSFRAKSISPNPVSRVDDDVLKSKNQDGKTNTKEVSASNARGISSSSAKGSATNAGTAADDRARAGLAGLATQGDPNLLGRSIYEEAYQTLSDEDKAAVGDRSGLDGAIKAAELLQNTCGRAKVSWHFKGKKVYLRDQTDKLFALLYELKPAGDFVANLDPTHLSLPWAGVKLLLEVAMINRTLRTVLLQGIERVLHSNRRLKDYLSFLVTIQPSAAATNLRQSLVKIIVHILEFLAAIFRNYKLNTAIRTVKAFWTLSDIEAFDTRCEELMVIIHRDAATCGRQTTMQIWNSVQTLSTQVHDMIQDLELSKLQITPNAMHDSRVEDQLPKCLPGTRSQLLEDLKQWTDSGERIFWLCGQAGTGKSTISRTLAEHIQSTGDVVASFFFKKTEAGRRDATYFFSTIVQQLVVQIRPLKEHVSQAMKQNSSLAGKGLLIQYQELIEQPLKACALPPFNIFLIIDALDECQSVPDVKSILKVLLRVNIHLRVFVTSRPESPIVDEFARGPQHQEFKLESIAPSIAEHDIKLFIEHELREQTQPSEDIVLTLTKMTTPLFIAASTLCNYILELDPDGRIEEFVNKKESLSSNMADFYFSILEDIVRCLSKQGQLQFTASFQQIVGSLAIMADPLDIHSLSELLNQPASKVRSILGRLRSVLSIDGPVRPLHLTFYESVVQPGSQFSIQKVDAHAELFKMCISLMRRSLKQDILNVKLPGTSVSEVDSSSLDKISAATRYASLYWSLHLEQCEDIAQEILLNFLSDDLLHWLEVMSWLGCIPYALEALNKLALRAAKLSNINLQLNDLIQDGKKFLQQNLYIIGEAPLQIYLSSLLSAPQTSAIAHHYQAVLENNQWFNRLPTPPHTWEDSVWSLPYNGDNICVSHDQQQISISIHKKCLQVHSRTTGAESRCHQIPKGFEIGAMAFSTDDLSITGMMSNNSGAAENPSYERFSWDLQLGELTRDLHPFSGKLLAVSEDVTTAVFAHYKDGGHTIYLDRLNQPHQLDLAQRRCLVPHVDGVSPRASMSTPHGHIIALKFEEASRMYIHLYDGKSAQLIAAVPAQYTFVFQIILSSDLQGYLVIKGLRWTETDHTDVHCIDIVAVRSPGAIMRVLEEGSPRDATIEHITQQYIAELSHFRYSKISFLPGSGDRVILGLCTEDYVTLCEVKRDTVTKVCGCPFRDPSYSQWTIYVPLSQQQFLIVSYLLGRVQYFDQSTQGKAASSYGANQTSTISALPREKRSGEVDFQRYFHEEDYLSMTISCSAQKIAVCSEKEISIWDLSLEFIASLARPRCEYMLNGICLSPDGSLLVNYDDTPLTSGTFEVFVYDLHNQNVTYRLPFSAPKRVSGVTFSQDSTYFGILFELLNISVYSSKIGQLVSEIPIQPLDTRCPDSWEWGFDFTADSCAVIVSSHSVGEKSADDDKADTSFKSCFYLVDLKTCSINAKMSFPYTVFRDDDGWVYHSKHEEGLIINNTIGGHIITIAPWKSVKGLQWIDGWVSFDGRRSVWSPKTDHTYISTRFVFISREWISRGKSAQDSGAAGFVANHDIEKLLSDATVFQ